MSQYDSGEEQPNHKERIQMRQTQAKTEQSIKITKSSISRYKVMKDMQLLEEEDNEDKTMV